MGVHRGLRTQVRSFTASSAGGTEVRGAGLRKRHVLNLGRQQKGNMSHRGPKRSYKKRRGGDVLRNKWGSKGRVGERFLGIRSQRRISHVKRRSKTNKGEEKFKKHTERYLLTRKGRGQHV